MAAITGIGKVSSFLKTSFPFLPKAFPCSLVNELISPISAPATKDFSPSPVTIKHLILFRSMLSKVLSNSSRTLLFKAFSALGRLIVKTAIIPSSSYLINSVSKANIEKINKAKVNI